MIPKKGSTRARSAPGEAQCTQMTVTGVVQYIPWNEAGRRSNTGGNQGTGGGEPGAGAVPQSNSNRAPGTAPHST